MFGLFVRPKSLTLTHSVLHHDVNPFNIVIEDLVNSIQGMLIDWEFVVNITVTQEYSTGGMVSRLFSRWIYGKLM